MSNEELLSEDNYVHCERYNNKMFTAKRKIAPNENQEKQTQFHLTKKKDDPQM